MPVIEEFTQQRIGEAEGDEDGHFALLLMRQLVGRLFDVASRIDELHNLELIEGSAGTLARFLKWRRSREEMRRTGVSALPSSSLTKPKQAAVKG